MIGRPWFRLCVVLVLLQPVDDAGACSCLAYPDDPRQAVAMAYGRADVIFLGEAISVRTRLLRLPPARETTFRLENRWKGAVSDTVVVRTNIGEAACGLEFEKDASYLVFAYWNNDGSILTTSLCELTRTGASAGALIAELDRLSRDKQ